MTSTSAQDVAFASRYGAIFSDHLISNLRQGSSLYNSFQEARWAVQTAYAFQHPWLDDDGDGVANGRQDGREAARRGPGYPGTFPSEEWPPYIRRVEGPRSIRGGQ